MVKNGTEALYSEGKNLLHAIRTKDKEAQQNAAHRMIQIAIPWPKRWWAESQQAIGKPLVRKPNENAHLLDLEWTEEEQAHLQTLMQRYT
jgi:hypothetical protein